MAAYRALGTVLTQHGFEGAAVGDEGGYGPKLPSNEAAIDMILLAFASSLQPVRTLASP